jgi:hypothetical protein
MKGSTSQAKLDQKEERKTRRVGVVVEGYVFWQHEVCCVCMPVKRAWVKEPSQSPTLVKTQNPKSFFGLFLKHYKFIPSFALI